jgi:hypothetical protein
MVVQVVVVQTDIMLQEVEVALLQQEQTQPLLNLVLEEMDHQIQLQVHQ